MYFIVEIPNHGSKLVKFPFVFHNMCNLRITRQLKTRPFAREQKWNRDLKLNCWNMPVLSVWTFVSDGACILSIVQRSAVVGGLWSVFCLLWFVSFIHTMAHYLHKYVPVPQARKSKCCLKCQITKLCTIFILPRERLAQSFCLQFYNGCIDRSIM
jgi:hypothetical protein